jgi:hypothetical protein
MAERNIDSFRGEQFDLVGVVTRGRTGKHAVTTVVAQPGDAILPVDSTTGFAAAGAVVVGGQVLTYTSLTGSSLMGIPTAGAGAITQTIGLGARLDETNAIDVRAGATLVFIARRKRGAAAVVQKSIGSGITIPAAAPGCAYVVEVVSGDTDTFAATELLAYELRLVESSGDETVIAYGGWKIGLGAS